MSNGHDEGHPPDHLIDAGTTDDGLPYFVMEYESALYKAWGKPARTVSSQKLAQGAR